MKTGSLPAIVNLSVAAAAAAAVFLSSCAIDESGSWISLKDSAAKRFKTKKPSSADPKSKYYSELHHIHVNERIIDDLSPSNSRIEIDLGDQRARIFLTGSGDDILAIETQISTGKQGNNTPDGKFKVLEKSKEKKSNLYGTWVDADTGSVLDKDGDSRKPPRNPNAKFKGTPMPYWLRVTPGGVGMHIGYVPTYPASHGCIRVPNKVQPLIFSKVRVGTPVTVTH